MKTIVLCIDRDDDIGRKGGVKGPIIGIEDNLDAANKLALADPQDSDVNALFEAIKTAKELGFEVVTLTGDSKRGVISDENVAKQMDLVMQKLKPESVILVTDGADDEQVLPIIQSRVKINSIQTVIVRQSKELEKAYFTVTNFLSEISKDPDLARLIFGIPGLILLLLGIGGALGQMAQAMNLILIVVGVYLIIKGLTFEEELFSRISDFIRSLSFEKIGTVTYAIAFVVMIIGVGIGYDYVQKNALVVIDAQSLIDVSSEFITESYSVSLILIAVGFAILGRIVDEYTASRYLNIRRYLIILAFFVLFGAMLRAGAGFLRRSVELDEFVLSGLVGILMFIVWVKITDYMFLDEIRKRDAWIEKLRMKDVYTKEDEHLGKVSRVILNGSELWGLRVGKKKFEKEDIISMEKKIVVRME
ncbi:MAG: hypothetical protein MSIBF_05280 [Candidatus Altiarchaeales archaeon IMC4]|nr:MAG: hypothetical protein MSIBF_05280 [Candidatus Altiarchaeales archaeon IMC4]